MIAGRIGSVRSLIVIALALIGNCPVTAQPRGSPIKVEVAAGKLNAHCGSGGSPLDRSPVRLTLRCVSLRGLIRLAYNIRRETLSSRRIEVMGVLAIMKRASGRSKPCVAAPGKSRASAATISPGNRGR